MIKWIHRLFNPHCELCDIEEQAHAVCNGCEAMRAEITRLQMERDRLLDHILNPVTPQITVPANEEELKPIRPAYIPWHVRKRELEEQDRAKARAMKDASKSDAVLNANKLTVEEIEHELTKDDEKIIS